MTKQIKRGEIYYTILDGTIGSEQGGIRPCLVVQNDIGNTYSPTVIIIPLSTKPKNKLPTHVKISKLCGLESDSIALAEQIRTVDKARVGLYVGAISAKTQADVDNAMAISVGLEVVAWAKSKLN